MFIVLAILLTAAALLAVAYPILAKAPAAKPATTATESLDELLGQRDAAMQALRELNFDHRVGKISDEDFVVFDASLKHEAAETLRALDQWEAQADADLDEDMESEIAAPPGAIDQPDAGVPRLAGARPPTTKILCRSAARRWPRRLPRPTCRPRKRPVPSAAGAPIPVTASAPAAARRCSSACAGGKLQEEGRVGRHREQPALTGLNAGDDSRGRSWRRRFRRPDRGRRHLRSLAGPAPEDGAVPGLLPHLRASLAGAANPDRALINLERFAQAVPDRGALLASLAADPHASTCWSRSSPAASFSPISSCAPPNTTPIWSNATRSDRPKARLSIMSSPTGRPVDRGAR